jgi:spore coat polysaccharide biosynthesis protein SpsF (cytidylyltransferase family)
MEHVATILQARTASTRLSNKVLLPLAGAPLLSHCIRRLKQVGAVIVATSGLSRDDPVEELAGLENVHCFRGSEADVLDRFYQASKMFNLQYTVRATGDNPLVDPREANRVMHYIMNHKVDYVTGATVVDGVGLPVGVGVEAFTFEALERSWFEARGKNHREHVNEYVLGSPDSFSIVRLKCLQKNSCPDLRLTIDTEDDLNFVREILKSINKPALEIGTPEIIEWWEKKRS